jgi:hypothetical protein
MNLRANQIRVAISPESWNAAQPGVTVLRTLAAEIVNEHVAVMDGLNEDDMLKVGTASDRIANLCASYNMLRIKLVNMLTAQQEACYSTDTYTL